MSRQRSPLLQMLCCFPVCKTALDLAEDQDDEEAARSVFRVLPVDLEHHEALDKQLRERGLFVTADANACCSNLGPMYTGRGLSPAMVAMLRAIAQAAIRKEYRLEQCLEQARKSAA